jgi:hypothetical protein
MNNSIEESIMPKTYLWKSMRAGLKSDHGNIKWVKGKWQKHEGTLAMCSSGFHASELIPDAMRYVNCEMLAKVEVRGTHDTQEDKQVWSEMKIVEVHEWTKDNSVGMAIVAAELVLHIYEDKYPKDDRPRKAIEAAKAYLKDHSAKSQTAAANAANAANAAYATANAAYAAAYAAHAASAANAAHAANAAAYAAYAAANAAYATANAAYANAAYAAYAAAYAANAAYAAYTAAYAADTTAAANDIRKKVHDYVLTLLAAK